MLEYTQSGDGARLMVLVHHDDAAREYAYGPQSKVCTFPDALMTEATKEGVDRGQHEERLEADLRLRAVGELLRVEIARGVEMARTWVAYEGQGL
jgi:hypothetical protein